MRFEDFTALPPVSTSGRHDLIEAVRRCITDRELAACPTAAAGDAAAAETTLLKNFFAAAVTKLAAVATAQDATP